MKKEKFTLQEKIGYFKNKWKKDHIFMLSFSFGLWIGVIATSLFEKINMGIIFAIAILLALILYLILYNMMMKYVSDNAYKNSKKNNEK